MTTTDNTAVIRQLEREVDLLREENKGLRCQVERLRADAVDEALRNYAAQWREPQVHGPFTRELVHDDIIDHADRLLELRGKADNE